MNKRTVLVLSTTMMSIATAACAFCVAQTANAAESLATTGVSSTVNSSATSSNAGSNTVTSNTLTSSNVTSKTTNGGGGLLSIAIL